MAKFVQKLKDKVAYEKESHRLGQEGLKAIRKDHPEMWAKKGGGR